MANPQLTVEITAKIDGLRDSFNKAVSEIKGLDSKTKSSLSSIDKSFGKLADDIEKNMKRSSNSISSASNSISKDLAAAAVATSKSKNTYMDLGRVLQDLPYGFNGIQNNLTQLIPSAGLAGLAFTALVSAITFAQVGTDYWTRGLKENKKAIDSVKLSGQEYLDTLTQLNQTRIKGEQDSTKELAQLKILYNAYTNANLPLEVRKKSYKDIQEQYPSYFKNIKFEQEASTKTVSAYNSLTQAILATGRARAAVDLIAKNETRKLENEQKIVDLEKEKTTYISKQTTDFNKRADAQSKIYTENQKSFKITEDQRKKQIGYISESENVLNLNKKINNIKTDNNLLDANNLQLIKSVNVELIKGAEIIGSVGSLDKTKDIKETIKQGYQLKEVLSGIKLGNLGNPTAQVFDPKPVIEFSKSLSQLRNEYGFSNEALANFVNISSLSFDQLLSITQQFSDSFKTLIEGGIVSTIGNLGASIGEAIANGDNILEASGKALLQGFGNFLSGYGDLLIKYGAAAIIKSKLDAAALIPGAGLVVGPLAIAAGIALKIAGSALSSFASKGGSAKSSSGGSGSSRRFGSSVPVPEPMSNSKYSGTSVTPSGTISSIKDMVPYGASNQTIIPEVRIGNDAIYIAYKRGEKQQSRI